MEALPKRLIFLIVRVPPWQMYIVLGKVALTKISDGRGKSGAPRAIDNTGDTPLLKCVRAKRRAPLNK